MVADSTENHEVSEPAARYVDALFDLVGLPTHLLADIQWFADGVMTCTLQLHLLLIFKE